MKKTIATLVIVLTLYGGAVHAATLLVDNNMLHDADYRTLQAAVDAASTGDTIILAGSSTSYGSATVSKRLNIYGNGYYLELNGLGKTSWEADVGSIDFIEELQLNAGGTYDVITSSDGSVVAGLKITRIDIDYADNITIKRNLFSSSVTMYIVAKVQSDPYYVNGATGINIYNNKMHTIYINSYCNADVNNNILLMSPVVQGNGSFGNFTNNSGGGILFKVDSDGEAYNNIFHYTPSVDSSSTAYVHDNFIANSSYLEDYVYVWTGSDDAKYQLRSSSPTNGYCLGGDNCGAYSGVTPYQLSGIPARPRVTLVEHPGHVLEGQTGMSVRVTAESHD